MESAKKGALLTAAVTSIVCLSDTILYSVLPVYAETIGLSDAWLGFFLSINRFVRIFSHGIIAYLILKVGLKQLVTSTTILSCISAYFYQFPQQLSLFAMSRMLWGFVYSGFRQSTMMFAMKVAVRKKETFALTQVIRPIGPFLILIFGPILFMQVGYVQAYFTIWIVSFFSIILVFFIPNIPLANEPFYFAKVIRISFFKILLFTVSFITDGLLVVILFILLTERQSTLGSVVATVSFFLLVKRFIASVIPMLLFQSYKLISCKIHVTIGLILLTLGILCLYEGHNRLGLLLCFMASPTLETTAPLAGTELSPRKSTQEVVTSVTFWWDLGKAFGALAGISLYKYLGSDMTWSILLLITLILLVRYYFIKVE